MPNRDTIRKPLFQRLINRVGNPLEWSYIEKILFLLGWYLSVNLPLSLWAYSIIRNPNLFPGLNRSVLIEVFPIHLVFVLLWVILAALAVRIRRRNLDSRWLAYGAFISIALHDAWSVCLIGHSTNPWLLMFLFAQVFIAYLLFEFYLALCAFASWILVLGYHIVGEQLGLIPYAPILTRLPYADGMIDRPWMALGLGVGGFVSVAFLILCGYVVHRWRDREAKVTELSELLKKMFGRYLSTEVMNSLIENPSALELGGERRKVTIMMTDL